MSSIDLFSKRQKQLRGEGPDVFVYDTLPQALRVQIVHIFDEGIGPEWECSERSTTQTRSAYEFIVNTLRREYGVFRLVEGWEDSDDFYTDLRSFVLTEADVERVLDALELGWYIIDRFVRRGDYRGDSRASKVADNLLAEINSRLREHGVGYQVERGRVVRVDSTLLHAEAVKPALRLLQAAAFAGAEEEFLRAYDHFRHDRSKEALSEALKSLESTLKAICVKAGWNFASTDTAKQLLEICFQNGLIPPFWQNDMSGLRATLEGGVPTARNKLSGHGQGVARLHVPGHLVAYALHLTAAAIVFLVQAQEERLASTSGNA